jgi:hypothetical protein
MSRCREKCTISNGLAWSPDSKNMYFVDSVPGRVYAYDYDVTTGDMCELVMFVSVVLPQFVFVRIQSQIIPIVNLLLVCLGQWWCSAWSWVRI